MSDQQPLRSQLLREIEAINQVFAARELRVRTTPGLTHIAGEAYVFYGLECAPTVDVRKLPLYLLNIQEALTRARKRPCPVRIQYMPAGLCVDHPYPKPLEWRGLRGLSALESGQMLAGRSYLDPTSPNEIVDLKSSPHVLIAGTTGSGKSTLQLMLVLTLMISTPPRDLDVWVIDLKNEDLAPLAGIPHVRAIATDIAAACKIIYQIDQVRARRVAEGAGPYRRILLVIDELGELQNEKDALAALGRITSMGRSKAINVILATQKPTVAIVGSITTANLSTRLVGRVVSSTEAATATGYPQTGAELLPGAGAFLRVSSAEPVRFQAYRLDPAGIAWLRKQALAWGETGPAPALAAQQPAPVPAPAQPSAETMPAGLAAVFDQYTNADGTLRYGGMRAAATALYGPDAPQSGRAYEPVKREIERWLEVWKTSKLARIHKLPLGKILPEAFQDASTEESQAGFDHAQRLSGIE